MAISSLATPFGLSSNSKNNTLILRRAIANRKRGGAVSRSKINDVDSKIENFLQLTKEITGTLTGELKKTIHWNKKLERCKKRVISPSKKGGIKRKYKRELIEICENLDKRQENLARICNSVQNQLSREEKNATGTRQELSRINKNVQEFVTDTLDEVNSITRECRNIGSSSCFTVASSDNKRKRIERKGDETIVLDPLVLEHSQRSNSSILPSRSDKPKVIITSLFKLYNHDINTDPRKILKRKTT